MCIPTGGNGVLYSIVVPTSVLLFVNFGSVIMAVVQYCRAVEQINDMPSFVKLLKFLGKLVFFQSFQWVLGVVFYFTANEAVKITFEVLVVFEGMHLAISYFCDVAKN